MKIGRNAPCPCGSGKKYKNCCLNKEAETPLRQKVLLALILLIVAGGVLAAIVSFIRTEPGSGAAGRRVWSEEHQHWHTEP